MDKFDRMQARYDARLPAEPVVIETTIWVELNDFIGVYEMSVSIFDGVLEAATLFNFMGKDIELYVYDLEPDFVEHIVQKAMED